MKASFRRRLSVKPRVLLPPKFRSFVMVSQYPWNGKSILERFTNVHSKVCTEGENCLWGNVYFIDTCASMVGKRRERERERWCNTLEGRWQVERVEVSLKTRARMNRRRSNGRKIRSIVAWGRVRTVDSDGPRPRERSQRAGLPTLAPLSRGPHHAMHTLLVAIGVRDLSRREPVKSYQREQRRSLMVCPLETCVEMVNRWPPAAFSFLFFFFPRF